MTNCRIPRKANLPGVQENLAMVDFPEIHDDGCSVFERAGAWLDCYRNAEECRELMRQTHKINFEKMIAKYFSDESN